VTRSVTTFCTKKHRAFSAKNRQVGAETDQKWGVKKFANFPQIPENGVGVVQKMPKNGHF
jgi:hypothetical protein